MYIFVIKPQLEALQIIIKMLTIIEIYLKKRCVVDLNAPYVSNQMPHYVYSAFYWVILISNNNTDFMNGMSVS